MEKQQNYHESVLLDESIQGLQIKPDGVYLDLTYGGGGHARLILERLGPKGRLLAFDQDEASRVNIVDDQRLTFIASNFRHVRRFVGFHGFEGVDGILADLGVSSHQFDQPERGFSYRFPDVKLDMRMDQNQGLTAAMILNQWEADDLQNMFSHFGEIRNSKTLAQAIAKRRHTRPFVNVGDLLEALDPLVRGERHRYLAQVFQALRIAVNDEMGALEEMLQGALASLKSGGRLVVLTYHSLEDRMIKRFMRDGNISGEPEKDWFGKINRPFELITRSPEIPGDIEIKRNSRAHSAKLRIAEKR